MMVSRINLSLLEFLADFWFGEKLKFMIFYLISAPKIVVQRSTSVPPID
jgi:hypothetical protein